MNLQIIIWREKVGVNNLLRDKVCHGCKTKIWRHNGTHDNHSSTHTHMCIGICCNHTQGIVNAVTIETGRNYVAVNMCRRSKLKTACTLPGRQHICCRVTAYTLPGYQRNRSRGNCRSSPSYRQRRPHVIFTRIYHVFQHVLRTLCAHTRVKAFLCLTWISCAY